MVLQWCACTHRNGRSEGVRTANRGDCRIDRDFETVHTSWHRRELSFLRLFKGCHKSIKFLDFFGQGLKKVKKKELGGGEGRRGSKV